MASLDSLKTGDHFRVKWMRYCGHNIPFLLQCSDGHCPFVCLMNILFLQRRIYLPKNTKLVSFSRLADGIRVLLPGVDNRWIHDTLESLRRGLIFNCFFDSTEALLEENPSRLFSMLGISVRHGWIADAPEYAVLRNLTYDELQRNLALYFEGGKGEEVRVGHGQAQSVTFGDDEAHAALEFLDRYATQLTDTGLLLLKNELANLGKNGLFALYRNNHLTVVTLRDDKLFALVTDYAFLEYECYWEKFAEFGYFDDEFKPFKFSVSPGKLTLTDKIKRFMKSFKN